MNDPTCSGCGFFLWNAQAKLTGLCAECSPDADDNANNQSTELEDQIRRGLAPQPDSQEMT